MSMTTDTATKKTQGTQGNRYRKLKRKDKIKTIVFILIALLMLGHIIYCLINHVHSPKSCHMCGLSVETCKCSSEMEWLRNTVAELETENFGLQNELELLKADQAIKDAELNDGLCHDTCPEHCPDYFPECTHPSPLVDVPETSESWKIVGQPSLCRKKQHIINKVCPVCDEVVKRVPGEVENDETHSYGSDDECNDCGYKKPATSKPVATATPKPTATATPKPTATATPEPTATATPEPTATATPEPTATATPEPTATATPEPTATATPKPTACPHPSTTKEAGAWSEWISVGEEKTCCKSFCEWVIRCTACNAELKAGRDWRYDYDHNFKGRKCLDCGYTKPLAEGSATADGTIAPSMSETEYEDGEVAKPVG